MLDNKNDNFGSADQNKSYGSNDDMVESDKVLWRYEDLLDKLLGKWMCKHNFEEISWNWFHGKNSLPIHT